MGFSIKGFFKTGNLWATLEDTLNKIRDMHYSHSESIKILKQRDIVLGEHIVNINHENQLLRSKLDELEKRLWNVNIAMSTNGSIPLATQDRSSGHQSEIIEPDQWHSEE